VRVLFDITGLARLVLIANFLLHTSIDSAVTFALLEMSPCTTYFCKCNVCLQHVSRPCNSMPFKFIIRVRMQQNMPFWGIKFKNFPGSPDLPQWGGETPSANLTPLAPRSSCLWHLHLPLLPRWEMLDQWPLIHTSSWHCHGLTDSDTDNTIAMWGVVANWSTHLTYDGYIVGLRLPPQHYVSKKVNK